MLLQKMIKIQIFSSSVLCFTEGSEAWGILFDPGNAWKEIAPFLKQNGIHLRYVLVTQPTFQKAFRVAQIKQETGAKFLSFQNDMLELRNLPKLADHVNVCGIRVPQIDRFLDGLEQIDLDGKLLHIRSSGKSHQYEIEGHVIPLES